MSLNLISDAWIPIRCHDGSQVVIAPWQMADERLAFPDWPRPDLNIACIELLVGLVFMADPPRDAEDWAARRKPDAVRLRAALAPYAPTFELLGDGPRFMQDLEPIEEGGQNVSPPDMLFIDSAGGETLRNNADLFVKRSRYPALDFKLAAIALYTLQSWAPQGGRGNRTSMRGGGPLVTLVDPPDAGLWSLVWANVPDGRPAPATALPWTRPTRTSENGAATTPADVHPIEAFFGMPRRLRLIADGSSVIGVVQRPYGTLYAGWEHPLTPHYRQKPGSELLPRHPRPGPFLYRNWIGVTARSSREDATARRARVLDLWRERSGEWAEALVAGWAMDNMKPLDFTFSRAPLIDLAPDLLIRLEGMVEAANEAGEALRAALRPVLAAGAAREAARESFFLETQGRFEERVEELKALDGADTGIEEALNAISRRWLSDMRQAALGIFDSLALPGLPDRPVEEQKAIAGERRSLVWVFSGYGKRGQAVFNSLNLDVPEITRGERRQRSEVA